MLCALHAVADVQSDGRRVGARTGWTHSSIPADANGGGQSSRQTATEEQAVTLHGIHYGSVGLDRGAHLHTRGDRGR